MNTSIPTLTREDWLTGCAQMIMTDILEPTIESLANIKGLRENFKYKISLGYAPNTKTGTNVLAVCMHSSCSAGSYNEIYVSPSSADSMQVLGAVVHELIHAADDCASGHQGFFATVGRAVGLEGKLTHSVPGKELQKQLQDYIELMGEIPHESVDLGKMKRQKNRNHLVKCAEMLIDPFTGELTPCGFKFNTSEKQINKVLEIHGRIPCNCCGADMFSKFN